MTGEGWEVVRTGIILAALGWNVLQTIQLKVEVARLGAQLDGVQKLVESHDAWEKSQRGQASP